MQGKYKKSPNKVKFPSFSNLSLFLAAGVDLFIPFLKAVVFQVAENRLTLHRADSLKIAYKLTRHVKPNLLPLPRQWQMSCSGPLLDNTRHKPAETFQMSPAVHRKRKEKWKQNSKHVCLFFSRWKPNAFAVTVSSIHFSASFNTWGVCCTDWLYWSAYTGMFTIKSRTFVEDGKQERSKQPPWGTSDSSSPVRLQCLDAAWAPPLGQTLAKTPGASTAQE